MRETTLCKIAKYLIYIFLVYILWFQYAYGVKNIILYSSVILAAACMLSDLLLSKQNLNDIIPTGVLINIVMCIYSLIVGLFVAKDQEYLVSAVITYSAFSIVCIIICYISYIEKSFDWLLIAIIVVDVLCAVFILVRGYYWKGYGYVLGPEHNPNILGMVMNLGLFCITFRTQRNRKSLILSVGLMLLFLYIIINCGSRKNLFAAVMICLLWVLQQSRKIWHDGRIGTRIGLLLIIALLIVSVVYYYENIYSKTDIALRMEKLGDQSEESSRNRMLYYRYAIDYFLEKPLFGIGLHQFVVWNPYKQYAHSTYAEAIADWGFFGCLVYFIPVVWAAVKLIKRIVKKTSDNMAKSIIALWIMEVFLGVGQIWFYEIEHLIAWTIIYLYVDRIEDPWPEKKSEIEKKHKYLKSEIEKKHKYLKS